MAKLLDKLPRLTTIEGHFKDSQRHALENSIRSTEEKVGEPGSGKTTLLRSIARELVRQQKILSVIDERRELFAGNTHGEALDVLAGLPKGQAVQMALRTLSPQVILLDELGGLDEVTALEQGLFSGVDFIATLHAATPEEATMRPQVKYLMERGAVRVLVWLAGRQAPGCIGEVRFL